MNIQVRYYTKSGNTKKLADAIASVAKVEALDLSNPITTSTDVLFLGGAVYAYGISNDLKRYIATLDPTLIKKVVVFSNSALAQRAYPSIAKLLKDKGIEVLEDNFYCRGQFLNLHKNHPDEKDIENAKQFTQDILNKLK